jgi:hypothetical protein
VEPVTRERPTAIKYNDPEDGAANETVILSISKVGIEKEKRRVVDEDCNPVLTATVRPVADPELCLHKTLLEDNQNEFSQEVLDTDTADERLIKP